jgi:acetolactate decarboxylase
MDSVAIMKPVTKLSVAIAAPDAVGAGCGDPSQRAPATNANLFSAVRVDGMFSQVRTRTVQRQARPFPPLTEAAKHQAEKVFTNVQGTLAGFRTPTYAQGIGVAGFHFQFLRQDKQAGGHALDYRLRAGKVQICTVHDLWVELPT